MQFVFKKYRMAFSAELLFRRLTAIGVLVLMSVLGVSASGIDDAKRLAEDGDIDGAIAILQSLEVAEPKNSEVPKLLGDYYWSVGREQQAIEAYESARKKGNRDATLALAEAANRQYRVDDARTLLDTYRKSLKKGKRQIATDESGDLDDRIDRTENMLGRVEKVEVIDSIVVDADEFFRYYRLSPESGSLNPVDVLPVNFSAAEPTVVYEPESRRQMIWAAPDSADNFSLFSSEMLFGDVWDTPQQLVGEFTNGGDANYPFMMPDGVTLYYSSDGDGSLGGYDIFISRRSDDGEFLQPMNLGMPYNSPYDDYMLAIDELTGVGWWASDRNRIPGKVTIYVFIPQELRVNVDYDADDLVARARLSSICSTWDPDADYSGILKAISNISREKEQPKAQFELALGGDRIYTRYEQFRNASARASMKRYVEALASYEADCRRLDDLRQAYSRGDRSAVDLIVKLERQTEQSQASLLQLRNEVIALER